MLACPLCAGANVPDAIYCGSCGTPVRAVAPGMPFPQVEYVPPDMRDVRSPARSGVPLAGGAVTIAGGGVGMISSLSVLSGAAIPILGFSNALCGFTSFAFGTLAVLGGVLAIRRRQWGLSLVGAILGLFSGGILFLASILCFVGVILIGLSDREFAS